MSQDTFILVGTTPIPLVDPIEWAQWFEMSDRIVENTEIEGYRISTIFLGLNHNFSGKGPPLLFETMIFPSDSFRDLYCARYTTWDEAQLGHRYAVEHYQELLESQYA